MTDVDAALFDSALFIQLHCGSVAAILGGLAALGVGRWLRI
jgi:hypothetical protein